MKVLHIVPSAFNYFDEVRKSVFELVGNLEEFGLDNYVFTLQYSTVNKRLEKEVEVQSKNKMSFEKIYNKEGFEEKLDWADIIHLHTPFLGMGKNILAYKKKHPQKKLLVTVHKNLQYIDFFTIIIWLYNRWYLNKIIEKADFVCAEDETIFEKTTGKKLRKDDKKFISLNYLINFINKDSPLLTEKLKDLKIKGPQSQEAVAYAELYRILNGE